MFLSSWSTRSVFQRDGLQRQMGSDVMYYSGLDEDQMMLQRNIRLKSSQTFAESNEENPDQKVNNPITLFGRQVGLMKNFDSQLPADRYLNQFEESTELGYFLSPGHQAKEFSKENFLAKKDSQTLINLEESALRISKIDTENAASVNHAVPFSCFVRDVESDRSVSQFGSKDLYTQGPKSCSVSKTSNRMLNLNEVPADESESDLENCCLCDLNQPYSENTQLSSEKSEIEDPAPFSSPQNRKIQTKDGTRSPSSYASCCVTDTDLPITKITHSRIGSRSRSPHSSDQFSQTHIASRVSDVTSGEPDCASIQKRYEQKQDSNEADVSVQMAAGSLIHISCNNVSLRDQDFRKTREGGMEYSCDSYELLTLNLTESSADDYCISSKPSIVLNNAERKDFGLKLKRGRRMKDFRKEVLPCLVSLSRHEICEDINTLDTVLRSREYKKMRAKTTGETSWSSRARSNRSRAGCLKTRKSKRN